MTTTAHHGVGLIVSNHARTRFYVQQKDASYPHYPRAYSLFGGSCEPDEAPALALARELVEELEHAARALLAAGPCLVGQHTVGPTRFAYSLFEVAITDAQLEELGRAPVFEGERGAVVTRAQLRSLPFIWGLEVVIIAYLERR
ncbi:NUDIX domain-containing protein [Enhygromyxa salina]|uniref:NUDIX domain protein n=1 Tax=Enhygromyxa salina TaxID=215803 RepID=A0A2S9YXC8_9BACT|nr:NUDIX domain-containing protein [Enhygromyxa salina]PRQ09722.1 NUDIX domain protein [Enhygromyxa salina]